MVATEGVQEDNTGASEATAPDAERGNPDFSHTDNVIEVELDSIPSTSSQSTSSLSSSDLDDIPLDKLYPTTQKGFSTSTKTTQKLDDTLVPMYPYVEERLISMQQRRIDPCMHLHADHPLQPPVIELIQFVPAAAEGGSDHVGTDLTSETIVSSKPNSPTTQNIDILESSIISNLEIHYSGELLKYLSNSQIAFDLASDEVMTECPPHQTPNSDMTTSTNNNSVPSNEIVVPEQLVPDQTTSSAIPETVSEHDFMVTSDASDVEIKQSFSTVEIEHSNSNIHKQPIIIILSYPTCYSCQTKSILTTNHLSRFYFISRCV